MKNTYYVIAKVDKRQPNESNSSAWPKLVAYSFEQKKILIEEGYGHGLMGGTISISSINLSDWLETFDESNCKWFGKYISNGTIENLKTEEQLVKILTSKGCKIKKINK